MATFNKATFLAYVQSTSGTITLSYTTAWSADPTLYGFTITGTPVDGDSISITYQKEDRGTIIAATPTAFNSTGWNLYNNATGVKYAKVVKYSDDYGYKLGGTYSLVSFCETLTGTPTALTLDDGYFNVPSDGYVFVTGGDATTYIYPTWSDWTDSYSGDFQTYSVDTIDLTEAMLNFPNGMFAIGLVRDEININTQTAINRIQRLAYSAENLASVIESGVDYVCDTDYIYAVLQTPTTTAIDIDGSYTVSDHGIEFFDGTTIPVITETLYGENLKDKLRTDVVTLSSQTLTATQKSQVLSNIGAASASDLSTLSGNLVTQSLGYSNSNGYVKMSNGLLIQWGDASIPVGSDRIQVTFPHSYNYHVPSIIFTPVENNNASGATGNLRIWQPAYTSFYVYNKSGSVTSDAIKFKWVAIGTYTNI